MGGETGLRKLLASMAPQLEEGEFVFCSVPPGQAHPLHAEAVGWFREEEGISLVIERGAAERAGLACEFVARMITLSVHSSLHAVGFLAAVTARLASAGISVNAVSAYHHDHLFVPVEDAPRALALLLELAADAGGEGG